MSWVIGYFIAMALCVIGSALIFWVDRKQGTVAEVTLAFVLAYIALATAPGLNMIFAGAIWIFFLFVQAPRIVIVRADT